MPEDLKQKVADLIGADLVDSDAYEAHRIAAGVPRGGLDFMYSTRFRTRPTWIACTASISTRAAMSARKWCRGCSIAALRGRGSCASRSRLSPETGVAVLGGDKQVGTMGSTAGGHGLALVRIDRVADALDAGLALTAGGLAIRLTDPNDVRTPPSRPWHEPIRAPAPRRQTRCPWPGEPFHMAYHDTEWGVPEYDDGRSTKS